MALSDAIMKLKLEDAAIDAIRQSIDTAKGKKVTTRAEFDILNSRIATYNERVAHRNREAEAIRTRSKEGLSKTTIFNAKVEAFNKLVAQLKSAATDYESKSKSLRIDLARLEESCSGRRRLVKE